MNVDERTYTVKRGNVVLRVTENEMNKYFDMGYDVYQDGKLVKRAIPRDVPTLQQAFVKHEKQIAELKAELESLRGTKANVSKRSAKKASE